MADNGAFRSVTLLKTRARKLHRRAQFGDARALARLRTLPELKGLDDAALVAAVRRRHALATVARQTGFGSWGHALSVLRGTESRDFGTLLYPSRCGPYPNIWCAGHDEARAIRGHHGGYLLAWRRHCLIVDEHFISALGLDPADEDWQRMSRDWVRPADLAARDRLYATLVREATEPAGG